MMLKPAFHHWRFKIVRTVDFMMLQTFAVRDGQWCIQNVGIEQAFRRRNSALTYLETTED